MKATHIFSFILVLLISNRLCAQTITYEYLMSSPLDEFISDIYQNSDGSIFFCGSTTRTLQSEKIGGLLVKLDNQGHFVDSIIITYPDKDVYINHIFPNNNQEFVIVATIHDTIDNLNAGILLCKMDDSLNLYDQTIFKFPENYGMLALFANMSQGENILAGGAVLMQSSMPRPFIYEFSNDFDSLKARFFPSESGIIFKLKSLLDGNYWIINVGRYRYELLDSEFNSVHTQRVPKNMNGNYGIKWDTDTSFYLLGDAPPEHSLSFLRQFHPIDTTGHLFNQWRISDTVDFPAAWNGIDFKHKDSIYIGGTRNMWIGNYNPWPSWFVILQMDSLLNLRWERFYGGDAYYLMGKLIISNDGGCIVSGTRYDYLNTLEEETDIIVLKLNSEGLIVGENENLEIKMQEALVFPNPGTNELRLRIAAQYPTSSIHLYDVNGSLVLEQDIHGKWGTVNTAFLVPGTYIYRITSGDGLFETGKWLKH